MNYANANLIRAHKHLASVIAVLISGCAVLDPQNVGTGYYLQQLDKMGLVVFEGDSSKNGYQSCANNAYALMQSNPAIKGSVICANSPTTQPLRYSIKLHSINSPHVNLTYDTSPFNFKFSTKSMCQASLKNLREDKKWLVLDVNC